MPRGGRRPGAGGISSWKSGRTKTIRVPEVLAAEILQLARVLDNGGQVVSKASMLSSIEPVTESKVIDLSKVSVTHSNGEIAVRLEDLARLGYEIKPATLAHMVNARIRRKSGK